MPCFRPVTAWKSQHVNHATGKRSLVFSANKGQLGSELQIPCGGCIGCRLDKARQWQIRIMHERAYHDLAVFLTLTYNNENLPKDGSLNKRHFQLFMKRLRKQHDGKIKFFHCGEYGDQLQRPHYHAILFGIDFADKRRHSQNGRGDQIWKSELLDRIWGMGHCWIGSVTHDSAGYVARYCLKKINGEFAASHYARTNIETGEIIHLQPEYITCSQGIGLKHFEEFGERTHARDSVIIKGKEAPVPKYYDRKLDEKDPLALEAVKYRRKLNALKRKSENTPERLRVREEVKKAQIGQLKRTI